MEQFMNLKCVAHILTSSHDYGEITIQASSAPHNMYIAFLKLVVTQTDTTFNSYKERRMLNYFSTPRHQSFKTNN